MGIAAALLIAGLLLGFRLQAIPDYRAGDIAGQHVAAPYDLIYEDKEATAERREAARDRTPAIYDFEADRISQQERRIALAFASARKIVSMQQVPPRARWSRAQRKKILPLLEKEVGATLSPEFLPVLLEQRFDPALEKRILAVLDSVLRSGLVADAELFRQHARKAVVLRDKATGTEKPLADPSRIRSMEGARDRLRQLHLEFAELSAPERAELFAWLDTLLFPTLLYNASETETRRQAAAARVPPVEIQVKKGKVLLRAGEEVSPRAEANLAALRRLQKPKPVLGRLLGLFFFTAAFLYALWRCLESDPQRSGKLRGHAALLVLLIVLVLVVTRLLTALAVILAEHAPLAAPQDPSVFYFAIPFSSGALMAALLVDLPAGVMVSLAVGAFAGLFYGDVYLAIYAILGGLAGIFSIRRYRERSGLLKSGLWIGAGSALAALAIHLLRHDLSIGPELLVPGAMGALSGLLGAALSSLSLPGLESLFKITTDIRLLELSNLNAPLLRRLALEAPGTYHHSLMAGALAEAAAEAIGANSLLVRVGAYYHDVGKMLKPEYFVENQGPGNNKNEALTPSLSRLVLASHVKDGLDLAKEAGLIAAVRDLIPQHHGTRLMAFFFHKAKENALAHGQEIREEEYRYPGPKPQTREAALLLMADAVEAASRTLVNPSAGQIQGMIAHLIDEMVADRQFEECDITFREIRLIKESFLQVLTGAHHHRIDYPGYSFTPPAQDGEKKPPPR